jgi:hypothetical protein
MSGGDIRVIGLVMGTHVLEDLGMDIPHGVTVTIPGEKAVRSKDLWRAISQKCLFQLPSVSPPPPSAPRAGDEELAAKMRTLEERNVFLEAEVLRLHGLLDAAGQQKNTLDEILKAVQAGGLVQRVIVTEQGHRPVSSEVADGSAPTFIPSDITPKDAESRIEVRKEESTSGDISSAREALRKLRQGNG